jgi:CBS domain-containing protein
MNRACNVSDLTDIDGQNAQYRCFDTSLTEEHPMLLSTPIVEIMKREPTSIEASLSIIDAIRVLSSAQFHHLPVVEGKRLVGIISTLDILKLSGDALGGEAQHAARHASRATVGDIMFTDVVPLTSQATVGDAARLLSTGEYHSIPIIADHGQLTGIVTTTDLVRHLLDESGEPEIPSDVRIRLESLEKVCEAAQSYFDTGMTQISRDHLEQLIQEARWAA